VHGTGFKPWGLRVGEHVWWRVVVLVVERRLLGVGVLSSGFGITVKDSICIVQSLVSRVYDTGFGFRVYGKGFRVVRG
jgi:hypothetical protein